VPRARPGVGRSAEPFEALSSWRKYESEHEGRQHFTPVTSGQELSGGWIRYCTAAREALTQTPSPRDAQIKPDDGEEAVR